MGPSYSSGKDKSASIVEQGVDFQVDKRGRPSVRGIEEPGIVERRNGRVAVLAPWAEHSATTDDVQEE